MLAMRAKRPALYKTLAGFQPINHAVQKTPHRQAKNENDEQIHYLILAQKNAPLSGAPSNPIIKQS